LLRKRRTETSTFNGISQKYFEPNERGISGTQASRRLGRAGRILGHQIADMVQEAREKLTENSVSTSRVRSKILAAKYAHGNEVNNVMPSSPPSSFSAAVLRSPSTQAPLKRSPRIAIAEAVLSSD
jgi:hypothetical protein